MPKPAISFKTDINGKIRNIPDFKTNALYPVFEAVVNSIQAIEDRGNLKTDGEIIIDIIRDKGWIPSGDTGDMDGREYPIKSFYIKDNGIGFNEGNFDSFLTAESTWKLDRGGKGVGRFYWLKAFDKVEIESIYSDGEVNKKRHFVFSQSKNNEISPNDDDETVSDKGKIGTVVHLNGFKKDYKSQSSAWRTGEKISQRIFEYILSYYVGDAAPKITVNDGEDTYSLGDFYEKIESKKQDIKIDKIPFTITHIKLPSTYREMHNIVLCANNRDVKTDPIRKYLGTSYQLVDENNKKFYYAVYVSSPYLDKNVNSSRLYFELPQDISDLDTFSEEPFIDKKISIDKIKKEVINLSKKYLESYLVDVNEKRHQLVDEFIKLNPSLRAVPKCCPEIYDEIEITSKPETINEIAYYLKGKAELDIKKRHDLLLKGGRLTTLIDIKNEVSDLTGKMEDFTKDSLISYILYRKKIIELLESNLERDENGNFKYEKIIHDIVFPMKTSSDEIDVENLNLWLIDELLISHQFATSDIELNKISSLDSKTRPDIFICCEKEPDNSARSISIIEFKRPGSEGITDPVDQLFDIMDNFKDKKAIVLKKGRDIHVGENTRFYCYAICDINDQIRNKVDRHSFSELKDGLGYSGYVPKYKANVQVLTFDKILADVKIRHSIFFDTLKI